MKKERKSKNKKDDNKDDGHGDNAPTPAQHQHHLMEVIFSCLGLHGRV